MKLKLDENLPESLIAYLAARGHDADSTRAEELTGQPDASVWRAAQAGQRLLITQDLDFSDARRFAAGSHHGVLLVRLARPGRRALAARVRAIFDTEDVEGWRHCFVVATDRKIRVRRPR